VQNWSELHLEVRCPTRYWHGKDYALGDAVHKAGSLDDKTRQLVKLAMTVGAQLEGATHSHARRALEMGISPDEIRHVVLLVMTTLGFPSTVAAYTWIGDVLSEKK
jgi:4-carboxymuconolactone decarboxylase